MSDNEETQTLEAEADVHDDLFLDEDDDESVVAADDVEGLEEPEAPTQLLDPTKALEAELAESKDTIAKLKDQVLRRTADLQNLRRRHERERQDLLKYGAENVLKEVVLVMDDLDRALMHLADGQAEGGGLLEGVQMVHRKFVQTLERQGVTKVEALGKPFDPNIHEALQQVDDDSVPHNHVLREFQSGYKLHDRLLRPALVVVGRGGPAPSEETEETAGENEATEE